MHTLYEKTKQFGIYVSKNYARLFIALTVFSFLLLLSGTFSSFGMNLSKYFWWDPRDTGMDFFNSMIYMKGWHPYTQYGTLYPPLANLLFGFFNHLVAPVDYYSWPDSFDDALDIRRTPIDLRVHQSTFLLFILFFLIVLICLFVLISTFFENAYTGMAVGFSCLLSFGTLYALERGNIVLLSLLFLLVFLRFYDSENKTLKRIAFISLAISAGLKLYPAFFGILILGKKKYGDVIRLVIYGIIFTVGPFAFLEGFDGIKGFIEAMRIFSNRNSERINLGTFGAESMVKSVLVQIGTLIHVDMNSILTSHFNFISYIIAIILLVGAFIVPQTWKKLVYVGVIVNVLQDSSGYSLVFLAPAMIYLCTEKTITKKTLVYFVPLLLLLLPIPLLERWLAYEVNHIQLFQVDVMVFLIGLLFFDMTKVLVKKIGRGNKNEES